MSEESKSGRKPSTPDLDRVIDAIGRGQYDDRILDLYEVLDLRRDVLRERVIARVKEVFGPDSYVVTGETSEKTPLQRLFERTEPEEEQEPTKPNPFITKPNSQGINETVAPSEDQLEKVERQMEQEPLDIERRGASIGSLNPDGSVQVLHPSDMGDR